MGVFIPHLNPLRKTFFFILQLVPLNAFMYFQVAGRLTFSWTQNTEELRAGAKALE